MIFEGFNLIYIIEGLVMVIIIGVFYSLWQTTKVYGGLIGSGLRFIGFGIIFFSLEALDRVLGNLSFVSSWFGKNADLAHNVLFLFGLLFSAIGFSRLTRITKQK